MRKGEKMSEEMKKLISNSKKGKKLTLEHRKKLSLIRKGRPSFRKGLKNTSEHNKKISEGISGNKNSNWKGGISKDIFYRNWQKNRWHHRNRNAEGSHTYGEWDLLKKQYNCTCPSCKKSEPEIKLTLDHIIPLSKGGSNNIENIQPLCLICNLKKHTKIIRY